MSLQSVKPVKPVAAYMGGKLLLAKTIVAIIADIPHQLYAEPFVGMGGIFFRRRFIPKCEIINDRAKDVANLFRILQRHYKPFIEMLRYQITNRTEFNRLKAQDPETLTDLERAARFLYLQRLSFGGDMRSRAFAMERDKTARFNMRTLEPLLEAVQRRLAGVIVENLDWSDFIRRYDRTGTLFYLDPPYYGFETHYGKGLFSREDYAKMADQLASLQGTFILSLNDVPAIRDIFGAFHVMPVKTRYILPQNSSVKVANELLISNYEIAC
ncbi:DNA adenine methylase [Bartonella sp. DGB2]|uniref:DNA adenine methylase n=1 Tax=Bartonella sp. DGB2 TaxID=3388426 RepID=UPI00398FDCAF